MNRPYCTLFMSQSLDGKISTGVGTNMDFDKDIPTLISGMEEYYEAEQHTDKWSMLSGATCVKLGANEGKFAKTPHKCKHVVIDSHKLTQSGINHIADNCQFMVLITDNTYPDRIADRDNLAIVNMVVGYSFATCLSVLYERFDIQRLTVQTGGTLNAKLLRNGLIDEVYVFIAPIIIGGKDTPTIADGESFNNPAQLRYASKLELKSVQTHASGFLSLRYICK